MKNPFFLLALMISTTVFAQTEKWTVNTSKSFIHYEGKHLLHRWDGENTNIRGLAVKSTANEVFEKIALIAYVRDFDSKNANRDAHALEVLEALKYPEIRFFSDAIVLEENNLKMEGTFEFHGQSVKKEVNCKLIKAKEGVILTGSFLLVPSDFGIRLPKFMMVEMEDLLTIDFKIDFKK